MNAGGESRPPTGLAALPPVFLLLFPGAVVLAVLRGLGAVPTGSIDGAQWVEAQLLLQGLNCILVLAWSLAMRELPPGRLRPGATLGWYVLFMLAWVPVGIGYGWLLSAAGGSLEPQPQLSYFVESDPARSAVWGSFAVVLVLGPVAEELVFRGYLQGTLRRHLGARRAVLLTAVLFGLFHGLQYAFPVTLLGLLFGWLRERYGGLAAPILAHILHNSVTVAFAVFSPSVFEQLYG